jgi:ferrochelatase
VILNVRPRKSALKYRSIWTQAGSPLLAISRQVHLAMSAHLRDQLGVDVPVALGMRYGNPSIAAAIGELWGAGVRRVLVLPLYPQYSATTVASTFDAVSDVLRRYRWLPELRLITHYHDHPAYITALTGAIRAHWAAHGQPDKLLLSFHGIPKRYFDAGDPYYCECLKTARLVFQDLNLSQDRCGVSFQSRFGSEPWLQPYTDATLEAWGQAGVKHVQVMCPGFPVDCLETLEEIGLENREVFLRAGGHTYTYIPALNDHPAHIDLLTALAVRHMAGWPEVSTSPLTSP